MATPNSGGAVRFGLHYGGECHQGLREEEKMHDRSVELYLGRR
jgi:hypothetical protein